MEPSNRVIDQWNHQWISSYVVIADSKNVFKSRLDSYWDAMGYGQLQRS